MQDVNSNIQTPGEGRGAWQGRLRGQDRKGQCCEEGAGLVDWAGLNWGWGQHLEVWSLCPHSQPSS